MSPIGSDLSIKQLLDALQWKIESENSGKAAEEHEVPHKESSDEDSQIVDQAFYIATALSLTRNPNFNHADARVAELEGEIERQKAEIEAVKAVSETHIDGLRKALKTLQDHLARLLKEVAELRESRNDSGGQETSEEADEWVEVDTFKVTKGGETPVAESGERPAEFFPPWQGTQQNVDEVVVRTWRHQVQKIFLGKQPPAADKMPEIDLLFSVIEKHPMTFEDIKLSKIGKVMERVAALPEDQVPRDAEFKFRTRAADLAEKCKKSLQETQ